uniref:Uncharacterized protein n=1 Tax=Arundo donax TaxID=35708 RepID=A0A0A8ZYP4_ARUDO
MMGWGGRKEVRKL